MWDEDEDEPAAVAWWVSGGWAELLIERISQDQGRRERSGRDVAALTLFCAAAGQQVRPGLVPLVVAHQLLTAVDLPGRLQHATTGIGYPPAVACLAAVDITAGRPLATAGIEHALRDYSPGSALEDCWPGGTLLYRGGGATWPELPS
jgi:hypothetical protein